MSYNYKSTHSRIPSGRRKQYGYQNSNDFGLNDDSPGGRNGRANPYARPPRPGGGNVQYVPVPVYMSMNPNQMGGQNMQ